MKEKLLTKNTKLAFLFSMASIIGGQAAEAVPVFCPDVSTIKKIANVIPVKKHPLKNYPKYTYSGLSTSPGHHRNEIAFSTYSDNDITWNSFAYAAAPLGGNKTLFCAYNTNFGEVQLRGRLPDPKERCQESGAGPAGHSGDHFDCN